MAKLCPRGKAAAKRKFKVYPSAYANMYASAVCSGKVTPGGKKRQKKATAKQQQEIVGYHYSVEQTKQQQKANALIKPTHVELFEDLKTNLIIFI